MAAKQTEIQKWLKGKTKDYETGVSLYAAHPTCQRNLLNTLRRKKNNYTIQKLEHVLRKAAEADKSGKAAHLKKKGNIATTRKKQQKKQPQKKASKTKKQAAQTPPKVKV